jgi:hypothetical protein
MVRVSVNGAWCTLRSERFAVNAWLQKKFSLTLMQPLPFFAPRVLDKKGAAIILFTDETSWRDAEDVPVSDYARDLQATTTVGPGGSRWYSIPFPSP